MFRVVFVAIVLCLRLPAEPVLYAAASFTKNYYVGAKLPPSGLFRRGPDGQWRQLSHPHPFLFSFARDPGEPSAMLLAAGNGLIRMGRETGRWTILTGSDVTELRDVLVDPRDRRTIYFAYVRGIRMTRDGGETWQELAATLRHRYVEQIGMDRQSGALLAGTEEGVFRSEDQGKTWQLAGAGGLPILRLAASPHDACFWMAATQGGGLFASRDCGRSFENAGSIGVGDNIYDIAFDPMDKARIAVGGWGVGVAVTRDQGKTWRFCNRGLPQPQVTSVVFDPQIPGRLLAAVHDEGIYSSDDSGGTWRKDGLAGGQVNRLLFVEEVKP